MTFTVEQIIAFIIGGFGLVLTILNIWDKTNSVRREAEAPEREQNERIAALEVKVKEHDAALHLGNDRFKELKQICTMNVSSTLALIEFEIDYCRHHGDENISPALDGARNTLLQFLAQK